jgi:hypothetical protein
MREKRFKYIGIFNKKGYYLNFYLFPFLCFYGFDKRLLDLVSPCRSIIFGWLFFIWELNLEKE